MHTGKNYFPGDEIVEYYGIHHMDDFLMMYGFIPTIYFTTIIAFQQNDRFYNYKQNLMNEIGSLEILPNLNADSKVLNYLRVLLSNREEVFTNMELQNAYLNGKQKASPEEEIKSLNYIIRHCTQEYNNTLPEIPNGQPLYLNSTTELSYHARLVIEYRDKLRHVLTEIINKANKLKNEYSITTNFNNIVNQQNIILS